MNSKQGRQGLLVSALALFAAAVACAALAMTGLETWNPAAAGADPASGEIALKTRIITATIYGSEAQVRRRGTVELAGGANRIVCDDLPRGFVETSLQIEGRGDAGAGIIGIDIVKQSGKVSESPRYRELKQKLETLEMQQDSLSIHLGSAQKRLEFITQLGTLPPEKLHENLAAELFRVEDWKKLMDFLEAQRTKTERTIRRTKARMKDLTREIDWIKGDLNDMRADEEWGKRVIVDCEAAAAGRFTFELAYVIGPAEWRPEYTIIHRSDGDEIDLTYGARIAQSTGEDWPDVSLVLSTARPRIGAAPPELAPHFLGKHGPPMARTVTKHMIAMEDRAVVSDELLVRGGRSDEVVLQLEATPASSAFAATFALPKPVEIESGAEPKRVLIARRSLAGELSRRTVPRLSPYVFIQADLENTLELPILGGTAEVYIETAPAGGGGAVSNFVGAEEILPSAPGQKFSVHLGVDQDIAVTHALEKKESLSKEGKSEAKVRFHYVMTLANAKQSDAVVILKDRLPVSTMKEIKVDDVDFTVEPFERGDDGIITWKIALAPGEKKEMRFAYSVVYPADWPVHYFNLGQ